MQLDFQELDRIIQTALVEDVGSGDITSELTISDADQLRVAFVTRQKIVTCGLPVLERIPKLKIADGEVEFKALVSEGDIVESGSVLASWQGNARMILALERTALNILQHMSAIATHTNNYVSEMNNKDAKLLDTRKTTPGLRHIEKYAVHIGGGMNHRYNLSDGIMIKDNHISACGGDVTLAVRKAKAGAPEGMKVEVECDTLEQVELAIAAEADILLLDNMNCNLLQKAVSLVKGSGKNIRTEASGGVTLETIRAIAQTGVDSISVGALTHSAGSVDIGLDAEFISPAI